MKAFYIIRFWTGNMQLPVRLSRAYYWGAARRDESVGRFAMRRLPFVAPRTQRTATGSMSDEAVNRKFLVLVKGVRF